MHKKVVMWINDYADIFETSTLYIHRSERHHLQAPGSAKYIEHSINVDLDVTLSVKNPNFDLRKHSLIVGDRKNPRYRYGIQCPFRLNEDVECILLAPKPSAKPECCTRKICNLW